MLPCSEIIFGNVQIFVSSKKKKMCQAPSYNGNIKICGVLRKLGPRNNLLFSSNGCGHSGGSLGIWVCGLLLCCINVYVTSHSQHGVGYHQGHAII